MEQSGRIVQWKQEEREWVEAGGERMGGSRRRERLDRKSFIPPAGNSLTSALALGTNCKGFWQICRGGAIPSIVLRRIGEQQSDKVGLQSWRVYRSKLSLGVYNIHVLHVLCIMNCVKTA